MNKFKRFLKTLLVAPLFLSACVLNNGLCMCEDKVDANNDGLCDICGKQIEGLCVHEDKDQDGVCDICGEDIVQPEEEGEKAKTLGTITVPNSIKVGETLTPEQVSVVVTYPDETTETVHPTSVTLDTSEAGTITGTVKVDDLTGTFTILVEQEAHKTILSLSDVSAPADIEKNATLETSQVTVVVNYSDGTKETINPQSISLDTSTTGAKQGTVSYEGKTCEFAINVVDPETPILVVSSLGEIYAPSTIKQNAALSNNEVNVVVYYTNNTSAVVHPDSINLSTSALGDTEGIVSFGGKTKSFSIKVVAPIKKLEVTSLPETIIQNTILSVNSITLKVTYLDDTFENNLHPDSIDLDTSILGIATGSYRILGEQAYFSIRVVGSGATVSSLTNISAPASIERGEQLSNNDVSFTVNYFDGTTAQAHPDSIDLDTSTEGQKTGTIHYSGVTATFTINVTVSKELSGIASVSAPSTIKQYATLSVSDVTVYLTYTDGSNGTAHPDSIDLVTSEVGTVTGTVHYKGLTKTFTITVTAVQQVTVYLVLTSVGLYKGNPGNSFDDLFLENTIAYQATPGTPLPGKEDVTHMYGNCDFDAWLSYENTGFPTVYANVPYEDNKILYASFVENGSDPVTPADPTIPVDPSTPVEYDTYYLKTSFPDGSGDWDVYEAQKMFAYVWNNTPNDNRAYEMTWYEGRTWKVEIPKDKYTMVVFCRVNPSVTVFTVEKWDEIVYNQTTDLAFEAGKHTAEIQGWGSGYGAHCPVKWIS